MEDIRTTKQPYGSTVQEPIHKDINSQENAQFSQHETRSKTEEMKENLKHQMRHQTSVAFEEGKKKAGEAMGKIMGFGSGFVTDQKNRVIHEVENWSEAVHCFAGKFRNEQNSNVADVADAIGDQIDSVTHYLRERDMKGLYKDAEALAHRRPELFIGGMFLAGLAIARFLKSSREEERRRQEAERFTGGTGYPGSYSGTSTQAGSYMGTSSYPGSAGITPAHVPTTGSDAELNQNPPLSGTSSSASTRDEKLNAPTPPHVPTTESNAASNVKNNPSSPGSGTSPKTGSSPGTGAL
jgi:hypothetical protein